ncbi:MAG: hypothetical protein RIS35_3731 [Pseudomonadota bacterium]|jgi:hypothetical protein
MRRPAPRRVDRRPLHAGALGCAFAAAVAVTLWLLGALGTTALAGGAPAVAATAQTAVAPMASDHVSGEAAAQGAWDLVDPLAGLDPDAVVDAVALSYADVVPASPAESPPEAVQRELRGDVERLATACRERLPSPLPGTSCDLPAPSIDAPQAGPVLAAPLAGTGPGLLRLRAGAPAEPAGTDPAPLLRPPRA